MWRVLGSHGRVLSKSVAGSGDWPPGVGGWGGSEVK